VEAKLQKKYIVTIENTTFAEKNIISL